MDYLSLLAVSSRKTGLDAGSGEARAGDPEALAPAGIWGEGRVGTPMGRCATLLAGDLCDGKPWRSGPLWWLVLDETVFSEAGQRRPCVPWGASQ